MQRAGRGNFSRYEMRAEPPSRRQAEPFVEPRHVAQGSRPRTRIHRRQPQSFPRTALHASDSTRLPTDQRTGASRRPSAGDARPAMTPEARTQARQDRFHPAVLQLREMRERNRRPRQAIRRADRFELRSVADCACRHAAARRDRSQSRQVQRLQPLPARPSHAVEDTLQNKKMWGTAPTFDSRHNHRAADVN